MKRCFPLLLSGFLSYYPGIISAQSSESDSAAHSQTALVSRDFPVSAEFRSTIRSQYGVKAPASAPLNIHQVWDYLKTEAHIQFSDGARVHFPKGPNLMTVENTKENLDAIEDLFKELSAQKQVQPVPDPEVPKVISYGPSPRALLWKKQAQETVLPKVVLENTSLQQAAGILAKLAHDQEGNMQEIPISIEPWVDPAQFAKIPGFEAPASPQDPTQNLITYSAAKISFLDAMTAIARPLGYYVHFQDQGIALRHSPQYFARRYLLSPNAIDTNPKPTSDQEVLSRIAQEGEEYAYRPRPKMNFHSWTLLMTETEERHREIEAILNRFWQDYYATEKTGSGTPKAGTSKAKRK